MHTYFHIPSCNVNHYPQCRLLRKFRVIIYCYLWSTVKPWIMKSIRFDGSVSSSMGTFENKMGAFFRALCWTLYQPQWHWKNWFVVRKGFCGKYGTVQVVVRELVNICCVCYMYHLKWNEFFSWHRILFLNGTFAENRRTRSLQNFLWNGFFPFFSPFLA